MPTPDHSLLHQVTVDPLLIDPQRVQFFSSLLAEMVGDPEMSEAYSQEGSGRADGLGEVFRPYNVTPGGTLIVPIKGALMNKSRLQFGRFMTGYGYIEDVMKAGMADPEVKRIMLDIDSPGGQVAGNFELVEQIAAMDDKPIRAISNDLAASAAYNIAAAADEIVVPRSGTVGSIGVVATHISVEGVLERMGIDVSFVYAGKHKIDGNPFQKLGKDVRADWQERVDSLYSEFVGMVAKNRGLDDSAVRDTEARLYDGYDAVDAGLADRVGSISSQLADFEAETTEGHGMTTKQNAPAAAKDGQFTQEQLDTAVAEATAAATTAGAKAERERISAILASDEAKDRATAAMTTAMETDMTVEQAAAFLAKLPTEKAETSEPAAPAASAPAPTPFAQAMDASGNPEVGAGAPAAEEEDDSPKSQSNSILASYAAVTGKTRKVA